MKQLEGAHLRIYEFYSQSLFNCLISENFFIFVGFFLKFLCLLQDLFVYLKVFQFPKGLKPLKRQKNKQQAREEFDFNLYKFIKYLFLVDDS